MCFVNNKIDTMPQDIIPKNNNQLMLGGKNADCEKDITQD